jgi:hypothetical protein
VKSLLNSMTDHVGTGKSVKGDVRRRSELLTDGRAQEHSLENGKAGAEPCRSHTKNTAGKVG